MSKLSEAETTRWVEIARGNVERNLGSDLREEPSADAIYDDAFTLAYDALVDAECPESVASEIATHVAMSYAQP